MEFDKNTQGTISDEARLKAETKQVTVQPLHDDIAPEDIPDSEIAAHHLNAGPIANSPNDTEQTDKHSPSSNDSRGQKRLTASFVIVSILAVCGVTAAALFFAVA